MKRTILVTGANRGIGLAIVKGLAGQANDIILLGCRDFASGEKLATQIGKNVHAIKLDLSNRQELARNIAEIKQHFGTLDVIINNAGTLNEKSFLDIGLDELDEVIRINTLGALELIRAFAPEMIKNNYGRIVNISSGWGSFNEGLTGPFSYSLTKASLNALTFIISKQLPNNVKINSMCPGWVKTRMGGMDAPRTPEQGAETALWLANLDEQGPTGGFFRDKILINW